MSPPPPTGVLITSRSGYFGQQFERRGALPRNDPLVVERMHQLGRLHRQDFREPFLACRQAGLANSTRAPAASMAAIFERAESRGMTTMARMPRARAASASALP